MERKAILIEASDVRGQEEIPGARVDIERWIDFLMSDLGGAWEESEIIPLHKPPLARVLIELDVPKDSYCFLAFSGHGVNRAILLNDNSDPVPVRLLKPDCERATIIVDACRSGEQIEEGIGLTKASMVNASLSEAVLTNARGSSTTVFARDASLTYARIMRTMGHRTSWEEGFHLTPKGKVEMLACAQGQDSLEHPESGGYYTSLLMYSAHVWHANASGAGIHTTKEAHDFAVSVIPPQQTPEYSPSWLAFPFAVKT